jgi:hypothetical protein
MVALVVTPLLTWYVPGAGAGRVVGPHGAARASAPGRARAVSATCARCYPSDLASGEAVGPGGGTRLTASRPAQLLVPMRLSRLTAYISQDTRYK